MIKLLITYPPATRSRKIMLRIGNKTRNSVHLNENYSKHQILFTIGFTHTQRIIPMHILGD